MNERHLVEKYLCIHSIINIPLLVVMGISPARLALSILRARLRVKEKGQARQPFRKATKWLAMASPALEKHSLFVARLSISWKNRASSPGYRAKRLARRLG